MLIMQTSMLLEKFMIDLQMLINIMVELCIIFHPMRNESKAPNAFYPINTIDVYEENEHAVAGVVNVYAQNIDGMQFQIDERDHLLCFSNSSLEIDARISDEHLIMEIASRV